MHSVKPEVCISQKGGRGNLHKSTTKRVCTAHTKTTGVRALGMLKPQCQPLNVREGPMAGGIQTYMTHDYDIILTLLIVADY